LLWLAKNALNRQDGDICPLNETIAYKSSIEPPTLRP
jgi:hypothetical protein